MCEWWRGGEESEKVKWEGGGENEEVGERKNGRGREEDGNRGSRVKQGKEKSREHYKPQCTPTPSTGWESS